MAKAKAKAATIARGVKIRKARPAKPAAMNPTPGPIDAAAPDPKKLPLRHLDPNELHPSPLNPRREKFDDDLTSLGDTIAAEGILQPLLVRESKKGFEIIFGTRRWRATRLAIGDKRIAEGFKLPCAVVEASDQQVKRWGIIENVARRNLAPLEEAEAFEEAFAEGLTVPEIAHLHGCSDRHVQRRKKLVNLAPEVKKLFKNGAIGDEVARAFADGTPKMQREFLEHAGSQPVFQASIVRAHMLAERFPVHLAAFDASLYTGEYLEDEENGAKYFADDAQAKKLQEAAIQEKVKALQGDFAWVDRLGAGDNPRCYERVAKSDADAGAVVYLDPTGRLAALHPVIRPETAEKRRRAEAEQQRSDRRQAASGQGSIGEGAVSEAQARLLTSAQIVAVKRAKTQALRAGVAASPKIAIAVAICGLLGARNVRISSGFAPPPPEWSYDTPALEREAQRHVLKPLAEALGLAATETDDRDQFRTECTEPEDAAKLLPALLALEEGKLHAIFALLISSRIGADGHSGHQPAEDEFEIALARATNAAERLGDYWKPDEAYFQAMPRDRLARLAIASERAAVDGTKGAKKSELVALLAGAGDDFWTPAHFAELQFADEKTLRRNLGYGEIAENPEAEADHAVEDLAQEEHATDEAAE